MSGQRSAGGGLGLLVVLGAVVAVVAVLGWALLPYVERAMHVLPR